MINESCKNKLESLFALHNDISKKCITAYNGAIYPLDFLALSVINRSYNLLDGFIDLIDKKNIIAATPLIRMQLDNVLRFYAVFNVKNPHDFALKILDGAHISNLEDINGKLMTDSYLVQKLVKDEKKKWISRVYNNTSGYVHFSEKHIYSTFNFHSIKNPGSFSAFIGPIGDNVDEKLLLECIDAFIECTELLMKYLDGWIYTKNNSP